MCVRNGDGGEGPRGSSSGGSNGRHTPLVLKGIDAVVGKLRARKQDEDERAGEHDLKHADALAACTQCGHTEVAAAVVRQLSGLQVCRREELPPAPT